jgi:hypothetical protein
MTTSKLILEFLKARPANEPVCAKQLLHLGARAAVDQALARLVKRGQLVRVARGFYATPIKTRFGSLPPPAEEAIKTIARLKGEQISPAGATVANAMGLSTQVPLRRTYVTSGRSRRIKLSGETIELRHGVQLASNPKHERLLRAIEWLGPESVKQSKALLETLKPRERRSLAERTALMPGWMAKVVNEAAHGGQHLRAQRERAA